MLTTGRPPLSVTSMAARSVWRTVVPSLIDTVSPASNSMTSPNGKNASRVKGSHRSGIIPLPYHMPCQDDLFLYNYESRMKILPRNPAVNEFFTKTEN